ncbi:xanthine phosphoribosyltransferase [Lactiplantibacillus fabifermentans]|uniref:Xanthine phosphoribosyltransferase n=2 Tax=Lactiplantibacillus fabifermentans TaxID=483011 RepID=A0A0R2NV06_9LACO|nr:xanthine phosphoribosyltransferase [Lactiplantibacillus fabifermentans]ETY74825.1 xanthine phosphoribosyltransferase [Lactiplantibacillus fabifermentans T30PCM01]KRO28411.1 xanthine phosphoribosyltransferase [Lactiplantibacillus fabifermentans DSM 21115]
MRELEERILKDGRVLPGEVLKVDGFLNHQIDPDLMFAMGSEFAHLFRETGVTKILTVESSGIAPAVMTGLQLHVPVVFARKHKSVTLIDDLYTAEVYSYTKKTSNHISISKKFLDADDKVLIIDDFLANGQAVQGLFDIADQAKCEIAGVGIVIEKVFQTGHQLIADRGVRLESLAQITSFDDDRVHFASEQTD